jgi:TonB family protein
MSSQEGNIDDARRATQRKMLLGFCAVSLGVHIGLVAGWLFFPDLSPPLVSLDDNVVKTRLVKLGKPRDDKLLPRVAASPPPPDATRATPMDALTEPLPEPTSSKQPSAADILDQFKKDNARNDVSDIIRDRLGEPDDEGRLDGDQEGTVLVGEIKASYFQRVGNHIKKRLENSSTMTDEERLRLRAELVLKVDADGAILDTRIQKSSGNTVYDNDVLAAAKRSSPLPAPPPQVRALARSGFALNFCPTSCS